MAIDFPNTPTVGQTFTSNGRTWQYTSDGVWDSLAANTSPGDFSVDGSFTASNYDVAGKNKIINGGFDFWQRLASGSTSFSNPAVNSFLADRWLMTYAGGSGATVTVSQQTFTPGTAPVAGYEAQYFLRYDQTVAGTGESVRALQTRIEDVRTLAGQTATISFWAKADTARTANITLSQVFGSGGSGTVTIGSTYIVGGTAISLTNQWQRFTKVINMPSIAGKTIGTSSYLLVSLLLPTNTTQTIDLWGVQLEAGSTATPFSRAGGTIAGELAACQRYYVRLGGLVTYEQIAYGLASATNAVDAQVILPVAMRIAPSATPEFANLRISDGQNTFAVTSVTAGSSGVQSSQTRPLFVFAATGLTQFRPYRIETNNTLAGYLGISAEL